MHSGVQAAGAGGGTHAMHGRSRITIDPRIPAMPGCLRFSLLVLGGWGAVEEVFVGDDCFRVFGIYLYR